MKSHGLVFPVPLAGGFFFHGCHLRNVENVEKWHNPRNSRLKSLWKTFRTILSVWKISL